MLFRGGPEVVYNYTDQILNPKFYNAKNLWRRNDILDSYLNSIAIFDKYIIKPNETPETISFNFYGSTFYGWTILIANDKTNMYSDWPRNSAALYEYVYKKYENPDAVMMYETTQVKDALDRIILKAGIRVPSNYQITYYDGTASSGVTVNPVSPVTYYQYEQRLNDEKEKIRLIKPSLIEDFVKVYKKSLNRGGRMVAGMSSAEVKID